MPGGGAAAEHPVRALGVVPAGPGGEAVDEPLDAHRPARLAFGCLLGGHRVLHRPVQLAAGVARPAGEAGELGDQRLLDREVQPLHLALAVRGEGGQAVHDDGQGAECGLDGVGGELQAAVDAYALGHRAERRDVWLVEHRHPHRGEHRPRGRGQGDGPAEQGAGAVVDDGRHPRAECFALRRQDQQRDLLVVHLPAPAAQRVGSLQVYRGRAPAGLSALPRRPFGRGQLLGERPLQSPQRHRPCPGPSFGEEAGHRRTGRGAVPGDHGVPGAVQGCDVAPVEGERFTVGLAEEVVRPRLPDGAGGWRGQPPPHGALAHPSALRDGPYVSGRQHAVGAQLLKPGHRRPPNLRRDLRHVPKCQWHVAAATPH